MRLAERALAFPQQCRVCKLDKPGVDFDVEDVAGWVYVCGTCLGEASKLLGGGVPKAEHDRVVDELNHANRSLALTVGEREAVAVELAQLTPELGRLRDQVDELLQTRVALSATITEQAERLRDVERGRLTPVDDQAKTAFAAASTPTPEPPAGRRRRAA